MSLILGFETSCDETAAAVVADGARVLASVVSSQHDLHRRYGGVVPEIASRAHLENLTAVVEEALRRAPVKLHELDAVAVGNRPGLIGSLLVGTSAAAALAWRLGKPLVGVDHVQAHLYAAALDAEPLAYPAIGLVVSGGHTSLFDLRGPLAVKTVGRTIDDAVGEAYDKAAVILEAGYPGGPALDKMAQRGDASRFDLPRSLLGPQSLDFSFSGLKTSLLYKVRGQPKGRGAGARFERSIEDLDEQTRLDLAAAFQEAAIETLIHKLERARRAAWAQGGRSLVIGGGVSANSLLRRRAAELAEAEGLALRLAPLAYCVDNAAMIAGLAHHRLAAGQHDGPDLAAAATTPLR